MKYPKFLKGLFRAVYYVFLFLLNVFRKYSLTNDIIFLFSCEMMMIVYMFLKCVRIGIVLGDVFETKKALHEGILKLSAHS